MFCGALRTCRTTLPSGVPWLPTRIPITSAVNRKHGLERWSMTNGTNQSRRYLDGRPISHPKPRPALIVSIHAVNDLRPDVLVLPITSQPGPLRVQVPDNPEQTGLRTASYAKCESLGPLHKSRLKQRIGVSRRRPGMVLKQAFGVFWG